MAFQSLAALANHCALSVISKNPVQSDFVVLILCFIFHKLHFTLMNASLPLHPGCLAGNSSIVS